MSTVNLYYNEKKATIISIIVAFINYYWDNIMHKIFAVTQIDNFIFFANLVVVTPINTE